MSEAPAFIHEDFLLATPSARRLYHEFAAPELTAQGFLQKFRVTTLCTTDDPTDDLRHHQAIARAGLPTRVFPAFRPDKALAVDRQEEFNAWANRLAEVSGQETGSFSGFLEALRRRHDYFHANGCRLSDHGLNQCFSEFCSAKVAATIFATVRNGQAIAGEEHAQFYDAVLWPARCGEGLDETTAPGSDAERQ